MWTADEPEMLGSLVNVDFLKDSISCGIHQHDIPMTSVLSGCNYWQRKAGRTTGGRFAKKVDKNKPPSTVQNSRTPHPSRIPVSGVLPLALPCYEP